MRMLVCAGMRARFHSPINHCALCAGYDAGAGSGLATVRGAGARMAMLASGVMAGIADALHAHSEAKEGK